MPLLKLIRWPNLLTIILTEIIIKFVLIDYFLQNVGLAFRLSNSTFVIIAISSVFIAATGNIINDINDVESDKINNHNSRPLINGKLSINSAYILLYIFGLIGVAFAIYSAILIGNIKYSLFQIIVLILLILYSNGLKCRGIIGNFLVSLSTALVPILIWFYTVNDITNNGTMFNYSLRWMHYTVFFFAFFAFFSNLIRELIKDREDIKADKAVNCKTWSGKVSIKKFKLLIIILLTILSVLIFIFQILSPQNFIFRLSLFIVQLAIYIFVLPPLLKASEKQDFNLLSTRMKIIMIIGILTPLFLWI